MKRYFIIAGEASGDMHAARLIEALLQQDDEALFVGMGGDAMQSQGCQLVQHYEKMAYMGFVDVFCHARDIRHNFRLVHQALLETRPDTLILVDYPSFNLRVAAYCRRHLPCTKIIYYIPPKVWAWKSWRVHRIGKLCDEVLGIFPFEPTFYDHYGYQCEYVGNPVVERIAMYKETMHNAQSDQIPPYIVLLPGSRRHEIEKCLRKMVLGASGMPDIEHLVVTMAPGVEEEFYTNLLAGLPDVTLTRDTYNAVAFARAAVVNSGTATLETALLGCPQVAVYHVAMGRLLELVKPLMFKIPYFTLVNIIAGKEVIRELLAHYFTAESVHKELLRLLQDNDYRQKMVTEYAHVADILTQKKAAETAAKVINEIKLLKVKR